MPDDSTWAGIATIVAVAASGMAVALGVDQLMSGSRLRNLEGLLRSARETAGGEARESVLASLHAATVGRLLAREAVPFRRFVLPVWIVLGSLAAIPFAWARLEPGDSLGAPISAMASAAVVGTASIVNLVHLLRERARVQRCYVEGAVPIRAYTDILAMMEGGPRDSFLHAFGLSTGLAGLVGGVSMLLAEDMVSSSASLTTSLVSTIVLVAAATPVHERLTKVGVAEPRNRDNSLTPTWVHPRDVAQPESPAGSQEGATD